MNDQFFNFVFTREQLIALQDAAANHINPWNEEDETLQFLADRFSEALKKAQNS